MALGPNIEIIHETTNYFGAAVMERGGVASLSGSGATTVAYDDPANIVTYAANPVGAKPIGVLFPDVKDFIGTGTFPKYERAGFEEYLNRKVRLIRSGTVQTNMIPSGVTNIVAETPAYLAADGKISNVRAQTGSDPNIVYAPQIGTWKSAIVNGYALLSVELNG